MVVLGLRLLVDAARRRPSNADGPEAVLPPSRRSAFRTGFLTNLLNPKVGAFYVALLPQFIGDDVDAVAGGVLLGLVHAAEGVLWFALVIAGAAIARRHLEQRRTERWIEALTGTALVAFGIRLARSHS
jgi:threonine/homoserine/homoserine lactone efflux protein